MTHFPVTALRSVDLETPDIGRSEQFYTSAWGLDLVTRHEGVTYLRASGVDHHVVALRQGERPALRAVTFRLHSDAEFEVIAAASQLYGATLLNGPVTNSGPDGGAIMAIRAPGGGVLRFIHGDMRLAVSLPSTNRPMRLAHVRQCTQSVARALAHRHLSTKCLY